MNPWRIIVAGKFAPPLYGDFEAQRNWLSLTHHLPPSSWYTHNLPYWGLDYPPLTAYHSWLLSWLAHAVGEDWVAVQGGWIEKGSVQGFMRFSVVLSEVVIWFPAVLAWCWGRMHLGHGRMELSSLFTILFQPALLLIDHGHFQYNSVMLGFTLFSLVCFKNGHDLIGAVFFVFALCFKQMALYYAPAIFAYLLGKCLFVGGDEGVALFVQLGFTTVTTFLLILSPFLRPLSHLSQVAHRVFPFARGLFEDKVANVWCAVNVLVKLRDLFTVTTLVRLAGLATLLAILPGTVALLWVAWELGRRRRNAPSTGQEEKEKETATTTVVELPTLAILPHALFVCSMGFFLFSFQVHEKSILLPLMPLTLLMLEREVRHDRMDWEWAVLVNNVAVFSMWPLLKRDGLGLQYWVVTLLWNFLIGYNPLRIPSPFIRYLSLSSYTGIIILHLLETITTPPPHLPDLFPVLNLTLSTAVFGLSFLWGSKRVAQECWAATSWFAGADPPSHLTSTATNPAWLRPPSLRSSRHDSIDSLDSAVFDTFRSRRSKPPRPLSPLFADNADQDAQGQERTTKSSESSRMRKASVASAAAFLEGERTGREVSDGEGGRRRRRRREKTALSGAEVGWDDGQHEDGQGYDHRSHRKSQVVDGVES
ncbi:glycosyltransferase family 57 protein [Atractiella rhizophila]|nr:glycosyltransferase family 57 protein [Atractiella rhizophila]